METITISKEKYEEMSEALRILRNLKLYKRLLEFENNIKESRIYTRENLGF